MLSISKKDLLKIKYINFFKINVAFILGISNHFYVVSFFFINPQIIDLMKLNFTKTTTENIFSRIFVTINKYIYFKINYKFWNW